MTRQEQIIQAAMQEEKKVGFAQIVKDAKRVNSAYGIGFLEGAKWADEHSIEMKEVDLMIHTIIAECCDWLASHTNFSHDEIEGCRNLMLTLKEKQLKAQKGESTIATIVDACVEMIIRLNEIKML